MTSANLDLASTFGYASASSSINGNLVLMPSCTAQTGAGQQLCSGDEGQA